MPPLLISNLTNIRYLTGLEMTAGVLMLHNKKKILFVDDRYTEVARAALRGRGSNAFRGRDTKIMHIADLPKHIKRYKRVRFESADLTHERLERWKKKFRGTKLIPSQNVIEEMRRKKTADEIKSIQKACRITDQILSSIPRLLKTGVQERDIAWKIVEKAHKLGADDMAFDTIVGFGPNSSRPHHSPTERRLKKGDIVQIDMGVKVNGYCSDCSRVFFTKKPTVQQKEVYDLLRSVVNETTKKAKTGVYNTALDQYARTKIEKAGFGERFIHSLGHGVGLEVHEGLNLSVRATGHGKKKLLTNEVVTIEPGIYFEGKWGMRIENTVLVQAQTGKTLTKSTV